MRHLRAGAVLTLANVCSAFIGLAVGFFVARQLGVEALGAAGIALSIVALLANACDMRLADVAAARFYETEEDDITGRAQLLRSCMSMAVMSGLAITILSFIALWATFSLFSSLQVSLWAFALFALSQGLAAPGNFLASVHRLGGWLRPMVFFQLGNAFVRAALTVSLLLMSARVESYALALALSEAVGLVAAVWIALLVWRRIAPISVLVAVRGQPHALWRRERRLLFGANLMGYTKLLHRAGDLLLVGWFCSDRDTGLYRLARSLSDATMILHDALGRTYGAALLQWLAQEDAVAYRRTARGLAAFGLLAALGTAGVAAFAGNWIIGLVVGHEFLGAGPLFAVLSLALFFVIGMQLWLWPLVLARGHVGRFAVFQGAAVLLGQYALAILIFKAIGTGTAMAFAVGHVLAYILTYIPAYLRLRRRLPDFVPP